jgi:hypothetical protein
LVLIGKKIKAKDMTEDPEDQEEYQDEEYLEDHEAEEGEPQERDGVVARAYRRSSSQSRQEREQNLRKRHMPFWITTIMIAGAAGLGLLSALRLEEAGRWVPNLPSTLERWEITEQVPEESVYSTLNYPTKIYARSYRNAMGEEVNASLVTAGPFENYHDPTVCVGGEGGPYRRTAQKIITLDPAGKLKVRAFIFQHRSDAKWRIIMYYWQQNRDGSTSYEPRMSTYQDMKARLETGLGAIVRGDQTCIVRIYGIFHEDADPFGAQTQRNVNNLSLYFYNTLLKDGKKR